MLSFCLFCPLGSRKLPRRPAATAPGPADFFVLWISPRFFFADVLREKSHVLLPNDMLATRFDVHVALQSGKTTPPTTGVLQKKLLVLPLYLKISKFKIQISKQKPNQTKAQKHRQARSSLITKLFCSLPPACSA